MIEDLIGQTFNLLTVIRRASNSKNGRIRWICKCNCNNNRELIVQANNLKSGMVKSCGCLLKQNHLIHGHTKNNKQSPEYTAWCNMISRCRNTRHPEYHLYGGAGLKVSPLFINGTDNLSGFEIFLQAAGPRPTTKHSLELYPTPFGSYEPGNIRWSILDTTKKLTDLTGRTFGRLIVLGYGGKLKRRILWRCQCSCEKRSITFVMAEHLITGHTRSCGCLKESKKICLNQQLNPNTTREYNIWYLMIKRCTDRIHPRYNSYGGRGIIVCSRWQDGEDGRTGFECFINDLGLAPNKTASLDRIDNNGNYEPGNCQWATKLEQAGNTRRNIKLTYKNKTQHLRAWAAEYNIEYMTLYGRYQRGWTTQKMLETPVRSNYQGRFKP